MKTAKFKRENLEHIRARVYDEVPQPESAPARGLRRAPAMALVLAALVVVGTFSVAAATGIIDLGAIYRAVFGAASIPFASESGGTVCESEGIKMEVVSVVADANGFYAIIDMTDLTGKQRLGNRSPEGSEGLFFWNIMFDSFDDATDNDGRGSHQSFLVIDTGEAWPSNHMTAVASLLTGGEVKPGYKWDLRVDRLHIQHAGTGQPDIDGEWNLLITADKLADTRKLSARDKTEEITVVASPISTNITIKFDDGAWRDIYAADPYNIPAVMYLTDGSRVEMAYQGGGGGAEGDRNDPASMKNGYNVIKYSYDLLDIDMIERIEVDRHVLVFAE
ncbi:MAG: hypothetical protein LBG66_04230 [Gallionellaceae bacterium]|jgi:hypothetical protein|nr:hypothetical protein [Gallionellaceae bacterium]